MRSLTKILGYYQFCCRSLLSHLTWEFLAAYPLTNFSHYFAAFFTTQLISSEDVPDDASPTLDKVGCYTTVFWKFSAIYRSRFIPSRELHLMGSSRVYKYWTPTPPYNYCCWVSHCSTQEAKRYLLPLGYYSKEWLTSHRAEEKHLCWYIKYGPILTIFSWVSRLIISQDIVSFAYCQTYSLSLRFGSWGMLIIITSRASCHLEIWSH